MKTKSEAKHTNGPWIVDSGMVQTKTGIPIAWMDREPGNGTVPVERDCNAHLIAAAPELLEALGNLVNECHCRFSDDETSPELLAAKKAIGKAKGE